ncbi:hypothetical protein Mapa_013915 [Marchantia paleacea]|nr:hypothetical protein Mapa_013915 [Marchantia paleacea]
MNSYPIFKSKPTCRKGRLSISSANMHAAAQMSTPAPYCLLPNSNSGARYQRAKTCPNML